MNPTRSVFLDIMFLAILLLCTIHSCFGKICPVETTCVQIKKCVPYTDLLKKIRKPLSPTVVNFLRSQECGFKNGFPKVCCSSAPEYLEHLKIFDKKHKNAIMLSDQPGPIKVETTTKVLKTTTSKYFNEEAFNADNKIVDDKVTVPSVLFNITVQTGPPDATPVPYLKKLKENNFLEDFLSEYVLYDLLRRRRSSKGSNKIDIEIR